MGNPSSVTDAVNVTGFMVVAPFTGAMLTDGGLLGSSSPGFRFPRAMIMRKLTIKATVVGSRRMLEGMVHAVAGNRMMPVIDKVFPFDRTLEAIRYMEAGAKLGKIVIKVA